MATGTIALDNESIFDADVSPLAAIQRTKMEQRTNARFPIDFASMRVWNAIGTNLPATPSSDDLGWVGGTFGTNAPYVGTHDLKAAGATSMYARFMLILPHDFEANQTLTLRAYAGMVTTISDGTATIDFEAWRLDRDGTLGSADLVSTSATTINSLTAAAKDFLLSVSTLAAGDVLDVRMTIAVNDAATATAVIGAVWQLELLADLR